MSRTQKEVFQMLIIVIAVAAVAILAVAKGIAKNECVHGRQHLLGEEEHMKILKEKGHI
jgi:hypothetical protein